MVKVLRRPIESALAAGIGVVDQLPGSVPTALAVALPQRHLQCIQNELGLLGGRG